MEQDAAPFASQLPDLPTAGRLPMATLVERPLVCGRDKALLSLVAVLIFGGLLYAERLFFHDDAYISLRYVRNWLDGYGLVWNRGEYVEGYTSFLFVALTAGLGKLGVPLVAATRLLGAAALLALVILARRLATTLAEAAGPTAQAGGARFMTTFLVVASAPFVIWLYGGLETLVLAALVMGAMDGCTRLLGEDALGVTTPGPRRAAAFGVGLVFGLGLLTRPDTASLALVAMGALLYRGLARSQLGPGAPRRVGAALFFALAFGVVTVPHLLWRHSYYGDWLPNTAYAKVSGLSGLWLLGLLYLAEFFVTPPFWLPLALGSLWLGKIPLSIRYVQVSILVFCLSVALAGGDHMPAFRLLVPIMAPCAVLGSIWLAVLAQKRERVGALLPWLLTAQVAGTFVFYGQVTDAAADVGMVVAQYVKSHWFISPSSPVSASGPGTHSGFKSGPGSGPPGPRAGTIALNSAGAMPYLLPENTYVDMLGLVDKHIARRQIPIRGSGWQNMPGHMKGDGAYVLARKPDYIIVGPAEGTTADKPWFLSDQELGQSAILAKDYLLRRVEIDVHDHPEHQRYRAMASGTLIFTYYERRPSAQAQGE